MPTSRSPLFGTPRAARLHAFLGALALGATMSLAPSSARAQATVKLLDYAAAVPAGWNARTPSSSMRLAEYTIMPAGAKDSAEVVIYFFGAGSGGTPDANLARWKAQFSAPAGGTVYEAVSRDSIAAARLTIAEYRGTYARGMGAGSAPADARPNTTLVAVVAETPKGTIFYQLFGPDRAVAATRDSFLTFVRSLR